MLSSTLPQSSAFSWGAIAGGVLVVNFFLGWTFVGWVVALAMACAGSRERMSAADVADEIEGLERLHEKGIISADEYAKRYMRLDTVARPSPLGAALTAG